MKAILVIDLPESCEECPFCDDFYYCIPEKAKGYVAFVEKSGRQEWCPLKPIPNEACEKLVQGLDAMEKMKSVEVRVVRRTE